MNVKKRLTRSNDKMVAGVLSGIGKYFDVDPTIIRIAYVVLSIASIGFPGLLAYLIMWAVIPMEETIY